jgi:hypothetical protein
LTPCTHTFRELFWFFFFFEEKKEEEEENTEEQTQGNEKEMEKIA